MVRIDTSNTQLPPTRSSPARPVRPIERTLVDMGQLDDLTAVVVAYGSTSLVEDCVTSLIEAGVPRVIVWDNSEVPEERRAIVALRRNGVDVVSSAVNLGFGAGNNQGAKLVQTKFVAFVNPDCHVSNEALVGLVAVLGDDRRVGVVAPRMRYPDGTFGFAGGPRPSLAKELLAATGIDDAFGPGIRRLLIGAYTRLFRSGDAFLASIELGGQIEPDWVSGFCMIQRTSVFNEIGGFDERFFLYFEDVDLCERLSAAGYRVVLNREVDVMHHESTSTGSQKTAHYWNGLATYFDVRGANLRARACTRIAAVVA